MSDKVQIGKVIAETQAKDQKGSIPYRPHLNKITGSVTASILLQQISYRWHTSGEKPFYKFRAPCGHTLYREDDSWTEELGMTIYEFDGALKRIGVKCKLGSNKTELLKTHFVVYWTDRNRVTWYQLNKELFAAALCDAYSIDVGEETTLSDSETEAQADLPKQEKSVCPEVAAPQEEPTYQTRKTRFTKQGKTDLPNKEKPISLVTETTTENTKEQQQRAEPLSSLLSFGFTVAVSKGLITTYGEERVREVLARVSPGVKTPAAWVQAALARGYVFEDVVASSGGNGGGMPERCRV